MPKRRHLTLDPDLDARVEARLDGRPFSVAVAQALELWLAAPARPAAARPPAARPLSKTPSRVPGQTIARPADDVQPIPKRGTRP